MNKTRRFFGWIFFILLHSSFILGLPGCAAMGVAAYKLLPPPTVNPDYTGLVHQSVGVMVWADRGIRIDWPTVQVDLANAIQNKFKEKLAAKEPPKSLLGTTFPVLPASIVRYQKDHPEIEAIPIMDVAPRLGITRLIYIELDDFATRSSMSVDLFRGTVKATVKVIEVENGVGKLAFERHGIEASYPPKSPKEGVPNVGDARIYAGTINAFGTHVVNLFVPYQQEDW